MNDPSARFLERAIGPILTATGAIALVAAIALMYEKVLLLEDPLHVPACTVDAVLACGAVMTSDQASAFGVPNPVIGIAGFAAVTAFGVALTGGAVFPRWLWWAIQGGLTFAVMFVHWLFFQTVYGIEALCPYCMVVWVMTVTAFVYVTAVNAGRGVLVRYHGVVLTLWLLALTALIGQGFWDYWRTKL